jgi:hypothetical protein
VAANRTALASRTAPAIGPSDAIGRSAVTYRRIPTGWGLVRRDPRLGVMGLLDAVVSALVRQALPVLLALVAGFSGVARAEDGADCRWLRLQRDALASAAMEQELALARLFRARLCPKLSSLAEGANARDGAYAPIDFAAWSRCRQEAEWRLEASHPVRYRNSKGFTFYTAEGASLARQADEIWTRRRARNCP